MILVGTYFILLLKITIKEKEYEEITHKRASVLNIFKNNCKERDE